MKKVLVLQETHFYSEPHVRGIFSTPWLAYNYITDYLNYSEKDAKEVFGGKRLAMELLRLSLIRERLPEILDWDLNEKKCFHFFSEGIELNSIECYEDKEDLPNQKEQDCPIVF
jgi:hypothetical protein